MSKQSKDTQLLHVATLGKSVGLHGDMKLHIKSDFPEQFQKGKKFYLSKEKSIIIASVNHKRGTIRLEGCQTPEEAKRYTNAKLFATLAQTKEDCHLNEGEYFWFDIEGCDIYENEKHLGKVIEIERILDQDYLKVKTASSLVEEGYAKTFLIPYIYDTFIQQVDIEAKKIEVTGAFDILEAS